VPSTADVASATENDSVPGSPGSLGGIVVLDLSSVGPASRATRLLADYGAEVIKVAPVPGAGAIIEPPFFAYSGQRGTKRFVVDLKAETGKEAFLALAEQADVVVESFRPGVVERLGIGYEVLAARNPAIVYCSTSGYGQDGPRAGWAGHDIDYLAIGGFLAMSGPRGDGGPPIPGATIADAAAGGMHAALAITTALCARAQHGRGAYLDVSVADGVLWLMSLAIDENLATGSRPAPGHDILSGRYACYDTYRAADNKWLAVGAIEAKFYANLCRALSLPQWIEHQFDDESQKQIRADFGAAFATKTRDQWAAELAGADTCVAPVLEVAEVGTDPQFRHRQAIVEARHPNAGTFRQVAPVLAGMVRPEVPIPLPDTNRSDSADLLMRAGVDQATLGRWMREGVVA
jgi:alpha-methylacyl-CoA racemase